MGKLTKAEKISIIDALGAQGLTIEDQQWYAEAKIKEARKRLLKLSQEHGMKKTEHYLKLKMK